MLENIERSASLEQFATFSGEVAMMAILLECSDSSRDSSEVVGLEQISVRYRGFPASHARRTAGDVAPAFWRLCHIPAPGSPLRGDVAHFIGASSPKERGELAQMKRIYIHLHTKSCNAWGDVAPDGRGRPKVWATSPFPKLDGQRRSYGATSPRVLRV